MFVNAIPPGALEIFLFVVIFSAISFIVVRLIRGNGFLPDSANVEDLPTLPAAPAFDVRIKRIFQVADLVLAVGHFGKRRLTIELNDFAAHADLYRSALKKPTAIALYSLARLQRAVAATEMLSPDARRVLNSFGLGLSYSGPLPNDYQIYGFVQASRRDEIDGMAVIVYRFDAHDGFSLEVAVEASADDQPFPSGANVVGTARLYGYIATNLSVTA